MSSGRACVTALDVVPVPLYVKHSRRTQTHCGSSGGHGVLELLMQMACVCFTGLHVLQALSASRGACRSDRVADSLTPACSIDLHFVEVSDDGIFEKDVLMARKEREQRSLDRFAEDMKDVSSLAAFSSWLHDTHLCYAVARQHEIGMSTGVSNKALASY